jgi:hypothetical protein
MGGTDVPGVIELLLLLGDPAVDLLPHLPQLQLSPKYLITTHV